MNREQLIWTTDVPPATTLVIAGFTGRERDKVQEHIDELAAIGVPVPTSYPIFCPMDPHRLQLDSSIQVDSATTSGEAEPVIFRADGHWWLTVGSDHTDREVERQDICASKQVCPKVAAATAWRLDSVIDLYDTLALSSDVFVDGQWVPYQAATAGSILRPAAVLDEYRAHAAIPEDFEDGFWMFLGTVPLLRGEFSFADRFRASLVTPEGQRLDIDYAVNTPSG